MKAINASEIRRKAAVSVSLLALAIGCGVGSAAAQDEELRRDEIFVTAQRREQALQEVPAAISALSESTLKDMGGEDFGDFVRALPGVEYQAGRNGENRITLRGVSIQTGTSPSVGVYIDETPVTTFAGEQINLKTFDVQRIEVLRGPQGTLYGEGSLGGTVRIITNKPDAEKFGAGLEVIGSHTRRGGENADVSAMVNVPLLKDVAALRVSGAYKDYEGWIDNVVTGAEGINTEKGHTIRAALRVTPTDNFTIDASFIDQGLESGGAPNGDENYNAFAGSPEPREDDLTLFSVTGEYDFGWASLVSASSWIDRNADSRNDFTQVAPLLSFLFMTPVDVAYITRPNDQEIFSQEVRLVSSEGGWLDWTVGGFYKHNNIVIGNSSIAEPAIPVPIFELVVDETIEQIAVFGEATVHFSDRLHGLVGLRYFEEDRDIVSDVSGLLPLVLSGAPAGIVDFSSNEEKVTPKFSLFYDVTPDALIYATASSGFRAGGINPQAFLFAGAPTSYGPESLWNYELGAKTRFYDGRVTFNVAGYYIDWKDIILDAFTGDPLFAFSVNGGEAHSLGVEFELDAQLTDQFSVRLAGNYTNTEIDETVDLGATPLTAMAGAKLPLVPEFKINAAAQYVFPLSNSLDLKARADVAYIDDTFSDILNTASLVNEGYVTLNMRLGLEHDNWTLFAFGNNLTDERGEMITTLTGESTLIAPRTIGLGLRLNY